MTTKTPNYSWEIYVQFFLVIVTFFISRELLYMPRDRDSRHEVRATLHRRRNLFGQLRRASLQRSAFCTPHIIPL